MKQEKDNNNYNKCFKTEFHVHTKYSSDSLLSYWLLLLMLKIKNINTVAITDHNEVAGALKYKNKFKKHGIEVIVGEEIMTNKGEIIGLGLNQIIKPYLSPSETIKEIKKQNGIVYVPHPYDEKRYKTVLKEEEINKHKKEIDYIEIHNGRNYKDEFSNKQKEISNKYKIKGIVGSDSHTFFELGRNYIITKEKITINNMRSNLEDAKYIRKPSIKFAHQWTKVAKLVTLIKKGDINGIKRIINQKIKKD